MAIYKVTNVYTYTTTVEVQAESTIEAKKIALFLDGESNNDDTLYESIVVSYTDTEDAE